ncbi:MAG: tetratricopeptide repeat protein [Candidatus Promineifilaceae bacterium]
MDSPNAYIPIDWRHALARGAVLPEHMSGATLFADISGFTKLSNALELELGAKRGAEALTIHLNRVYNALINVLHRMGGSVIGFAGDAITCWLDGDDGWRAIHCALAMQRSMRRLGNVVTRSGREIEVGVKVAVATGNVRRFLVGDPEHRLIDTMVGDTLDLVASAESVANRGDVVVTETVFAQFADTLNLVAWRDSDKGERFAIVDRFDLTVTTKRWGVIGDEAISAENQQAWLLPPVYQRLASGLGDFLAEFRPATALFVRFVGLNFDEDPDARDKLDQFIRGVMRVLMRFGGNLIQLTVGDKGSYLYAAFGAPIVHENDATRAGNAALAIMALSDTFAFLEPLQIGLAQGRMRAGAYGSETRRTYGVLGSNVVLSARLMMVAKPGQILVSSAVYAATSTAFRWETVPNVTVKGFDRPIALSRLLGTAHRPRTQALEPNYALPMIGRQTELAQFATKVDKTLRGRGQIVGITGEAGMGKSRLTAETIKLAQTQGLYGLAGECQSHGTTTSYLVWHSVWRSFFGIEARDSTARQIEQLKHALTQLNPAFLPRLPLLGKVLNLSIPDNDLTGSLDAKIRKSSLESLLASCLRLRAQTTPLLIVLEDCHWLDDLSRDLIGVLGREIANLPVLLLLVYRPPDRARLQAPPVDKLAHFTEIMLAEFSAEETAQLVTLKLAEHYGDQTSAPESLLTRLSQRAAGNPFYIEELLNYLQALEIDIHDVAALDALELPSSIHSLVLSRIDQLNESQQITMKVASVIGRLFRAAMVWGIYPDLQVSEVQLNLDILSKVQLTPEEESEPELSYLFKHIMTQQVAYESLLYATREMLHGQIGSYIETTYPTILDRYTMLLAFHYEHSGNVAKQREYLRKAGDAARTDYANTAAINYYQKLLPLLDTAEQIAIHLSLASVYEALGAWASAETSAQQALTRAQAEQNSVQISQAQIVLGEVERKRGNYAVAATWYAQALSVAEQANDSAGVAKALICIGTLNGQQGQFDAAQGYYERSLAMRREQKALSDISHLLNNLGIVRRNLGDLLAAKQHYVEALAITRQLKNRYFEAVTLANLGNICNDLGELRDAQRHLEQAVVIQREVGNKWYIANALHNLGNVLRSQDKFEGAMGLYAETMQLDRELNDSWSLAYLFEDIGLLAAKRLDAQRAFRLIGAGQQLRSQISASLSQRELDKMETMLAGARAVIGADAALVEMEFGRNLTLDQATKLALI